jgi:putative endonuclease
MHASYTSILVKITLSAMLSQNQMIGDALMNWLIYIVECRDGSLYTGIDSHNAGTGARYTAARRPVRLVYSEDAASRSAASKREISIKRLTRKAKQALYLKP